MTVLKKWIASLCVTIGFLLMLTPLAMMLTGTVIGEDSFNENRELSQWPVTGDLTKRIRGIEDYLNDHLGLREQMINAVLHMDLLLGESGSDMAIIGRDGWLYYDEGESILDIARKLKVDEADLEMVAEAQRQIFEMVTEAGSHYYILMAPDKHTIYPQHLPLKCVVGRGSTQLDQIYDHLRTNTSVPYIDLRPGLIIASEKEPVYYKTDTHWNTYGAYAAYQLLMDEIENKHPGLHRLTDEDIERLPESRFAGDISGMAGARDVYFDLVSDVKIKNPASQRSEELDRDGMIAYVNPSLPSTPSMLLLHDSFGPALIPYLRESVSLLYTCDQDYFTSEMITGDVPDIVIIERVERNALWLGNGVEETEEWYEEEYWEDE